MTIERHALVIGGTGYLGEAVVRALVGAGARVSLTYGQRHALAAQLQERLAPQARAFALDLEDERAARALVDALCEAQTPPTILIHCAALAEWITLPQVTTARWTRAMTINVTSVLWLAQQLSQVWRARALEGDIILPLAVNGVRAAPAPAAFGATQGARQGLMRALSKELGPHAIRVNAITFGPLEGGIASGVTPKIIEDYKHFSSLSRLGRADEAAALITWLALQNRHMTGATLEAEGGL